MSTIAKRKVLFVDDQMHWRDMVCESLAQAGFEVLTASDGSEAMRQAGHSPVGLIIVDEDLDGESGVMLTKFLRRNHPGVPTMLYTNTVPDAATVRQLSAQGVDRCLPKGSMKELASSVCRCLS
jgi:DNA-binding response OmpR family regulator